MGKIKPLNPNDFKKIIFIKDLGFLNKKRYIEYQCSQCKAIIKCGASKAKKKLTSKCKKCNKPPSLLKHGKIKTRIYTIYHAMKQRCSNPKNKFYKNYGKRGITVCGEWLDDFMSFYDWAIKSGYKENLEIDREDNNKGYSPDNCRWVTHSINNQNTRKINIRNTSGYRGVCWHKKAEKWMAQIKVNDKSVYLGLYNTALEGAKAYDNYVISNNLEHTINEI